MGFWSPPKLEGRGFKPVPTASFRLGVCFQIAKISTLC